MASIPLPIQVARIKVAQSRPFYNAALYSFRIIVTEQVPTLATDKHWRLYVNPQFVESITIAELEAALMHEIGHNIRDHAGRFEHVCGTPEEHTLSNIAGDCEINDDLKAEGLAVGASWMYPATFQLPDKQMAEYYYDEIRKQQQKNQGKSKPCNGGQGGQGMPQTGGVGQGNCGSSADGKPREWELPGPGDPGHDQNQHGGISRVDAEMVRSEVARQAVEYASTHPGKVPSNLERWAKQRLKPQVNWRREIRAVTAKSLTEIPGMQYSTYKKTSRRQESYGDIIMPGWTSRCPEIGIGVDTSGSMSEAMLAQALGEIDGAIKVVKGRVRVISGDHGIHTSQRVMKASDVKLVGGGGTDVGLHIQALDEMRPKIDLMILVTDCYTPWPAEAPRAKVLIVRTVANGNGGGIPPWPCRVLDVDPEQFREEVEGPVAGGKKR